jgi:hypothetical protein
MAVMPGLSGGRRAIVLIATRKAKVMKNTILAATAALALALSVGAGFAAERAGNAAGNNGDSSSSVANHCASILADRSGHAQADVQYCEAQQ